MTVSPISIHRVLLSGWAFLCLFGIVFPAPAEDRLTEKTAQTSFKESGAESWKYLLYLPDTYEEKDEWPVLIWLHGRSLRGDNLSKLRRYGPPSFLDERPDFPFVTICPQLPDGSWPAESLGRLLDEILDTYKVDNDRVYLSGVSLGAIGAWTFANAYPDRFAALVPVCAHGPASAGERLINLPIWAFHGDADKIVPIDPHQELIESVNSNGGNAKLTVIPGGTHGSIITPVYQREDLYEWMLEQER